ncbi:hypothetical protein SLEP1_g14590 [Rubroshorea leprosula]|uniref:Uncharacterized protein n=1 Tax=Rubroshorea leprosula TaxID=152421 RepID=A0AAV5ITF6_9ROSI|nr:hypothetical protein SLEP1_g14590 [Rubroshorea leprosula]
MMMMYLIFQRLRQWCAIWIWIQKTTIYMIRKLQGISMRTLKGQLYRWSSLPVLTCKGPLHLMEHLPYCMAAIQSIISKNLRYSNVTRRLELAGIVLSSAILLLEMLPPDLTNMCSLGRATEDFSVDIDLGLVAISKPNIKMASTPCDKYRPILQEEPEKVQWRHGGPPRYDDVNRLFEEGRTKEWPEGSLEETVQNAIKSWEMELSHKVRLQDFKTINQEKFKLIVNG